MIFLKQMISYSACHQSAVTFHPLPHAALFRAQDAVRIQKAIQLEPNMYRVFAYRCEAALQKQETNTQGQPQCWFIGVF